MEKKHLEIRFSSWMLGGNPFEYLSLIFLSNPLFYKTGKIFPFSAVSQLVLTNIKLKQSEESSKKLVPNV